MPNHVKHDITFSGARVAVDAVLGTIRGKTKGDDGEFPAIDFEELVPMPASVRETMGLELTFEQMAEMRKAGKENWYDWRVDHWGTKWNAFDVSTELDDEDRTILHFSTAWDTPHPILRKLVEICRKNSVTISGLFADEDLGANCGRIGMDGATHVEDGSPLAEEIAEKVWDYDPDDD